MVSSRWALPAEHASLMDSGVDLPLCAHVGCTVLVNPQNKHDRHLIVAVDCGSPSNPKGGSVTVTTTSFGGTTTYTCNKGLTLIGASIVQCLASGMWSASPPSCISKYCSHSYNTKFQSVLNYLCSTSRGIL